MTQIKANRIKELRTGKRVHSLRALSEVICKEFPDEDQNLSGNQLHGQDLCFKALEFLFNTNIKLIPLNIREQWDV